MQGQGSQPWRWPRRLAVLLAAGLLLLLVAEFLVRVLHEPPVVNSHMISDPLLGYRMRRNIDWTATDESGSFPYRLNSQSFPGPELPSASAPPPAGGRILLIGDSYLNPWLIRDEDWVGNVVRAELTARGPAPEVYALACDDYGTGQELLLLRRHGERVAPTTVVLLLYAGNDVINNSLGLAGRTTVSPGDYFRPYLVDEGEGELVRRHALPWRARLRYSRLFAIAEARWLRRFGVASELQEELSGEPVLSLDERVQAGRLPDENLELLRAPAPGGVWERAWRDTEVLLLAFQRDVAALGARFVVVVIPSMLQVEDDSLVVLYDDALRRAGSPLLSATLDWNWPEQHLETVFHRAGIEHVMLLAPLRHELEQNGPSVHRKDGHMNGRGQALMGRRLAARLAPDAPDECFVADESSRPVELERLYPADTLELDFAAGPCFELIGWGWEPWRSGGPPGPGWITHGTGLVLAPNRTGTLRLRGVLAPENRLPVTLVVSGSRGQELLRRKLEGAGEFELSVRVQAVPEHDDEWIALALAGSQRPPEPATLVLTGMSFRP